MYDSTPTTFVVTSSCQDSEFASFVQRFRELESVSSSPVTTLFEERMPRKHCENNVWLVKPAAENQGPEEKITAAV